MAAENASLSSADEGRGRIHYQKRNTVWFAVVPFIDDGLPPEDPSAQSTIPPASCSQMSQRSLASGSLMAALDDGRVHPTEAKISTTVRQKRQQRSAAGPTSRTNTTVAAAQSDMSWGAVERSQKLSSKQSDNDIQSSVSTDNMNINSLRECSWPSFTMDNASSQMNPISQGDNSSQSTIGGRGGVLDDVFDTQRRRENNLAWICSEWASRVPDELPVVDDRAVGDHLTVVSLMVNVEGIFYEGKGAKASDVINV